MGLEKSEAALYVEALSRGALLVLLKADHSRYDRLQDFFRSPQEEEEEEEWPGPVIDPLPPLAWQRLSTLGTKQNNPKKEYST